MDKDSKSEPHSGIPLENSAFDNVENGLLVSLQKNPFWSSQWRLAVLLSLAGGILLGGRRGYKIGRDYALKSLEKHDWPKGQPGMYQRMRFVFASKLSYMCRGAFSYGGRITLFTTSFAVGAGLFQHYVRKNEEKEHPLSFAAGGFMAGSTYALLIKAWKGIPLAMVGGTLLGAAGGYFHAFVLQCSLTLEKNQLKNVKLEDASSLDQLVSSEEEVEENK